MQRKILYIVNPISGTRAKKDLWQFIEKRTEEQQIPFSIITSELSGDYRFLKPEIEKEGYTDIVIAGGDGTVNQVVGSLMECKVNFGIIPCGSGNGLAYAAGISKQPAKALDVIFSGQATAVDGFLVNGRFACMLCGVGFDAKVAHEFAVQSKRGLMTYARLVSKNFFSASPYTFSIDANGLVFTAEAYFISVANSNQFGNNFTIAPKALLSDGLLDIVIAKKTVKPLLLINLVKQILAGKLRNVESSLHSPVIYFQTEKIKISNAQLAPVHIDGEPVAVMDSMEITVKKKCFRFIQPA